MSADTTIHFDGRERAAELAISLIQQAKSSICFFGMTLDNVLLDHAEVVTSISAFSRRHPMPKPAFLCRIANWLSHKVIA